MLADWNDARPISIGLIKLVMGDGVKSLGEQNFQHDSTGGDRRREGGLLIAEMG